MRPPRAARLGASGASCAPPPRRRLRPARAAGAAPRPRAAARRPQRPHGAAARAPSIDATRSSPRRGGGASDGARGGGARHARRRGRRRRGRRRRPPRAEREPAEPAIGQLRLGEPVSLGVVTTWAPVRRASAARSRPEAARRWWHGSRPGRPRAIATSSSSPSPGPPPGRAGWVRVRLPGTPGELGWVARGTLGSLAASPPRRSSTLPAARSRWSGAGASCSRPPRGSAPPPLPRRPAASTCARGSRATAAPSTAPWRSA